MRIVADVRILVLVRTVVVTERGKKKNNTTISMIRYQLYCGFQC